MYAEINSINIKQICVVLLPKDTYRQNILLFYLKKNVIQNKKLHNINIKGYLKNHFQEISALDQL